jgi:hypothetical protein
LNSNRQNLAEYTKQQPRRKAMSYLEYSKLLVNGRYIEVEHESSIDISLNNGVINIKTPEKIKIKNQNDSDCAI